MGDELKWACQNGDVDKVKEILDKGAKVDGDVGMGRAPIHVAADYGQTEVLELLVSRGANVNGKDKHGLTPLINAVFESHVAAVSFLLNKGADKTVKAPSGDSLVDVAENSEIKAMLQ